MGNEVATIFLDTEMRIKWFTPAIQTLFDLIEKDVGRPIANFSQKFADAGLLEKAQAAVEQLATFEAEVHADAGRCYLLRVLPYRTRDNRIAGAVATFIDITALKATEAQIAAARDYAEAIVETIRDPLLVLTADLRVRSANSAFYALFREAEADTVGTRIYELGGGRWDIADLRRLLEEALSQQRHVTDFEVELDAPGLGPRCFVLNARCIEAEAMRPDLILLAIEDITERRDRARHEDILIGELSHRVKNTLAVVQSIAVQTLRHSGSLEAFGEAFQGRLQALANANDAVIDGNWKGVTLKHIIERALRPFGAGAQVVVNDSPVIDLRPQASLALAMILHELATNAVKYGALSVPAGHVLIGWRIDLDGEGRGVTLEWTERGGPSVETPLRRGQGTKFIERSIGYEIRGKAEIMFDQTGLRAVLTFPLTAAIVSDPAASPPIESIL